MNLNDLGKEVVTAAYQPNTSQKPILPSRSAKALKLAATLKQSARANEILVSPQLKESTEQINLPSLRNDPRFQGIDGQGFSVVIIDTGIDLNHSFFGPDQDSNGIADRIVFQYDFADQDNDASDFSNHGSHVASIVGSEDATYSGVAPGVDIIALKVFSDGNLDANLFDIERALQWVRDNATTYNIASVNLSLGFGNYSTHSQVLPIADELADIRAAGVIAVSSSGNEFGGIAGVTYPSADANSLSIGAVNDTQGTIFSWSQRHPQLTTTFAPGGPITAANRNGGVTTLSGTSMAAPHVTGAVVLAQQLGRSRIGAAADFEEIDGLLRSTGPDIYDSKTQATYKRLDVLAMSEEILKLKSVTSSTQPIGEFGRILLTDSMRTIELNRDYDNPVIFINFPADDESHPGAIRLTDVRPNSFSAFFQQPNYLNRTSVSATVSYLVLEAGNWQLNDGSLLQVGTVFNQIMPNNPTAALQWSTVNFNQTFSNSPAILTQVQTYNDHSFVYTRQRSASNGGFQVRMQEEEALVNTAHNQETVGWLAISAGQGNWSGHRYQAGTTADAVTHQGYTLNFDQPFDRAPQIFGSIASFDGKDPVGLRYQNLSSDHIEFRLEEEQSFDLETNHTTESVSFLSLEGSGILQARAVNVLSSNQTGILSASEKDSLFKGTEGDRLSFDSLKEEGISSYLLSEDSLTSSEAALSCLYPPATI